MTTALSCELFRVPAASVYEGNQPSASMENEEGLGCGLKSCDMDCHNCGNNHTESENQSGRSETTRVCFHTVLIIR